MKTLNLKKIISISTLASILLTGCGSSSSDVTLAATTFDGQLVDNYVENADYVCGDGETGVTTLNGNFSCKSLPITFSLAGLKLGRIVEMTADKQIFPQDLVGVDRTDTNNAEVVAMARFLQSCDEDREPRNGIKILQNAKDALVSYDEDFVASNLDTYAQDVNVTLVDENISLEHLTSTVELTDAINQISTTLPTELQDALLSVQSTLSQDLTNALSYMGNEERLAYDIYNKLYSTYPDVKQFTNIATKSEIAHIKTVQVLVQKYISEYARFTNINLPELGYKNTDVLEMQAGTYDISGIQNLYNALIAKGETSKQDALEVGCMVEVTDINDLDRDILLSQYSNANDVTAAFDFLRNGSYSHYWSFDSGLKTIGVTEGCCSLGVMDGVDYCHPEYPQNAQKGSGMGH